MERYAVSSFALSIAGIAQAVGNAMNGQHWLAYVWCGAGWVIVYEVVLYSKWGLPKRAKIGIIVAIAIISFSCVAIATGDQNIKLEIGKQPTPNSMGHKYVHVRAHNRGSTIAQCNVYLTHLTKDGKAIASYTDTNIVLKASNVGEYQEQEFSAQTIAPGGQQDFDLFYTVPTENKFLISGKRLGQLPTPPSDPGEYVESITASGSNCGPVRKTYVIQYIGGFDATWDEKDSGNIWLPHWLRRRK